MYFLISLFFIAIEAKCGLWYQFSHTREGPFRENRYTGGSYWGDTQWAAGYESLDQQIICNDEEMFQQCNRAQHVLDALLIKNNLPLVTIGCADHIICSPILPANNGKFYCQNMDSYDLCLRAQELVTHLNYEAQYPIRCVLATMLSDNVPVINYRKPGPVTTTTTVVTNATQPPNTTTPTSTPALAVKFASGIMIVLFISIFM